MDRQLSLNLLADILEDVLKEQLTSREAVLQRLPNDIHRDVHDVLCNVDHYLADRDIRQRDPHYRHLQDQQMRALIRDLRAGMSTAALMKHAML